MTRKSLPAWLVLRKDIRSGCISRTVLVQTVPMCSMVSITRRWTCAGNCNSYFRSNARDIYPIWYPETHLSIPHTSLCTSTLNRFDLPLEGLANLLVMGCEIKHVPTICQLDIVVQSAAELASSYTVLFIYPPIDELLG